ncbi:uncharacterized protein DUF955 [Jatrophihabitans sp. GAS493]|uniref:ImmA/IrrE family metallo-endopeptidase n=1 Tax=Jatrophihabitans sp. GAS493 TaxID=1907575 RepID=UPI000BB7CCB1|nr:ImmA/IrrE family metallo-endopeptidase [Jatrophihabitans sp. GAS493]SOD73555.1 uncharacterized protein DUF955 [Jatrophihabitans sp. GAS493]
MKDTAIRWLLPPRRDPIAELTRTVRKRHDLSGAFDADALVALYADVTEHEWHFDCDAVLVGLGTGRPHLYLRRLAASSSRRRRFTLGHELGHLVIPWHLGRTACHALSFEDAPNQSTSGAAGQQIAKQEREATEFASALLVPHDLLIMAAEQSTLQDLFDHLDAYNVSTMAGLLALRNALLPGFVFVFSNGEERWLMSPGSSLPAGASGSRRQLARVAHDMGAFECGGRRVQWFNLNESTTFELVDDERGTSEILRSAIAAQRFDDTTAKRLFMLINGIVAGKLSKDRAATTDQALSIARGAVRDDPRIPVAIREHDDFDLYLRRKAEERIANRRAAD